jgi:arylsulfatase A
MKHLILISTLFAAFSSVFAAERPNMIVFFVDDLGWTDLGCFGSDFYETPNVDRLAAQGVKFTQAYAACTVCSPSRAALLTGQYPARLHVTDFIPGHRIENTPLTMPDWTQRLKLQEVTVAELLKDAGYRTAHLGKWHLTPRDHTNNPNDDGNYPDFYPEHQGFDFNIGGCERGAPSSYFWPYGRGESLDAKKRNNTFRTMPRGKAGEGTYLTDQLADEAVRLVAEFDQDPFFMYFPFYNVHTPLQGRPDLVDKYKKKLAANPNSRHRNVKYAAMVESFDEAIGRVLQQVDDQGVSDRTVVVFSSDNGGLCPKATSNLPLRQGKGSIYEGGVRVPTIVKWPGVASPGTTSQEPVITMDFFPTVLEAAGVEIPAALLPKACHCCRSFDRRTQPPSIAMRFFGTTLIIT